MLTHASAAARGSIQKQIAIEGLALYWQPGSSSSDRGDEQQATQLPGSSPGKASAAASPSRLTPRRAHTLRPKPRRPPLQAYLLQPTDCDIQATLQLSAPASAGDGGGGLRVHAAMVVHHLPLSLSGAQAADMLLLSDRLAWVAARNKVAPYCPTGWRQPGPRTVPWRWVGQGQGGRLWVLSCCALLAMASALLDCSPLQMPSAFSHCCQAARCRLSCCSKVWRFAVNAVLYELRGERQGAVRWMDGPSRVAARKQVRGGAIAAARFGTVLPTWCFCLALQRYSSLLPPPYCCRTLWCCIVRCRSIHTLYCRNIFHVSVLSVFWYPLCSMSPCTAGS